MTLLAWLLACGPAPEAPEAIAPEATAPEARGAGTDAPEWPPAALELPADLVADLERVRREIGLAARDEQATCVAVRSVLEVRPRLEAHLGARQAAAPEGWDDAISDLTASVPGFVVGHRPGVVVAADWVELSRAVGESSTGTALISVGAVAGARPAWAGPPGGPPCVDHVAALPWIDRLGPSLQRAPACLRDILREPVTVALGGLVTAGCLCPAEADARAAVASVARELRNVSLQPEPPFDGAALAATQEATVATATFGGACAPAPTESVEPG